MNTLWAVGCWARYNKDGDRYNILNCDEFPLLAVVASRCSMFLDRVAE